MNNPLEIEKGLITEQLTDEEASAFHDAIELYLYNEVDDSDFIIATEIDKIMWKKIWIYRETLKSYYDEENDKNA